MREGVETAAMKDDALSSGEQTSVRSIMGGTLRGLACFTLRLSYKIKALLLRFVVGEEALACVLQDAVRPDLVLTMGGATLGNHVRVGRGLVLHGSKGSFRNLSVGDDVHIGRGVLIDIGHPVIIGNRCGLGMYTKVLSHQNVGGSKLRHRYPSVGGPIVIADDVVIASNSCILYPTSLQPGTLVSAGSVVRGTYDKACVLMGNPARVTTVFDEQSTGA